MEIFGNGILIYIKNEAKEEYSSIIDLRKEYNVKKLLNIRKYAYLRGGVWLNAPKYCLSADGNGYNPGNRNFNLGFRVVCRFSRS